MRWSLGRPAWMGLRMVYPAKDRAIKDIASWIELRCNHFRLHSILGYRVPNEAEREFLGLTKMA